MKKTPVRWSLLAATAAALGCGDDSAMNNPGVDAALADVPRVAEDVAPEPITVQPLSWNAAMTELGALTAVVESGDDVVVFGERGMQWLSGGAVLARDTRVMMWRDAASVPAGDGSAGRWVLAIDGAGHIWRVRDRMTLEDVTGRYGLGDQRVRSVAALDEARTVFGTDMGFAVADGTRVLRWNDPRFATVLTGAGRVAASTPTGPRVFEVMGQRFVDYTVEGASAAALDAEGRLLVGTATGGLWREQSGGTLVPGAPNTTGPVRSIARSGSTLWVIAGAGLGVFDATEGVRLAAGVTVPADARLVGSSNGSVWVLGEGRLARYALSVDPRVQQWEQEVRPVFARRCTPCHLPGGTASLNLTRYQFWVEETPAIRRAVVVMQRMPPPPATLTAEERDAIVRWLDPPADAGADAGTDAGRDAGTGTDAGPMDAGTGDAAVLDSGPRDTGVTDRGPLDSGPRDTGVTDRGPVDSGPRDTGVTDRGPIDSGVLDSGPRDTGVTDRGPVDSGPRDTGATDSGPRDGGSGFGSVYPIIQRACVSCHGSSGGLTMSTEALAYANLVGAGGTGVAAMGSACGASGLLRVTPGDALASLIYLKIRGGTAPPCGAAMPRGQPTLPAGDIAAVRAWIEAGARR
jgi:mono/diheme cytochrome c family protein